MKKFPAVLSRHKKGYTLLLLTLISVSLILVSTKPISFRPREITQTLFAILQRGVGGISNWFVNTVNSISELKKAKKELENAQKKLLAYEKISRDIIELKNENKQLRDQLKLYKRLTYRSIPAEVIARDPENLFSTIVLNKGTADGVKRDMAVIAYQNGLQGLVGKIILVNKYTSTVKPILDSTLYIAAMFQKSRYNGLISGSSEDNSGYLVMKYINKEAINYIEYGDLVITSGLGGVYPKGIHIGRVRKIEAKTYQTSMEVFIEPIIDFSRLEYVFILEKERVRHD